MTPIQNPSDSFQGDLSRAARSAGFAVLVIAALFAWPPATWCRQRSEVPKSPSTAPPAEPTRPTIPKLKNVNPEILRLVIADQWDRGHDLFGKGQARPSSPIDWKAVTRRDAERESAVRRLLAAGRLHSGLDYFFASLIFQHSGRPQNLLLAHVLAVTAVAKGDKSARFMAAATLDRYLHSIGQPQVFGTQFFRTKNDTWTMEPYNKSALSDAERAIWCVAPEARQGEILAAFQKGGGGSTELNNCK